MRRVTSLVLAVVVLAFSLAAKPTAPASFSDNFNGGNLTGWWFSPSDPTPSWRIEDRVLLSPVGDHRALVDRMVFSSQAIETSVYLNPARHIFAGGVTLWYQDAANYVLVAAYPAAGALMVVEIKNGLELASAAYGEDPLWPGQWYRLRVDADSVTGALAMYVDGIYAGTHYAQTDIRSGFSGLCTGNGDSEINYTAAFDDFKVTRPAGGKKK